MMNPGARNNHETACARRRGLSAQGGNGTHEGKELETMACTDCHEKDLELVRKDHEVKDLERRLGEQAGTHPRLGPVLEHGKAGECTNCQADLHAHNETVIKDALANISNQAVLELALARNVVPSQVSIQVPD